MIASTPVRVLSLAIVALVVLVGVRGIVGGLAFSGGLLDGSHGTEPAAAGGRTPAVVESVLDGDTVEVTTRGGKTVRVRFLGISAQRSASGEVGGVLRLPVQQAPQEAAAAWQRRYACERPEPGIPRHL